jgi:hypothetical protein
LLRNDPRTDAFWLADPARYTAICRATLAAGERCTVEPSAAYRVQVQIAFDNGRRIESEAVILTGTTEAPYHVLYWRDDASNGPGQLRGGMGLR